HIKEIPDNSIDSCVTDPPYELNFMNQKWDATGIAYNINLWKEVYRVLKPGAHLLAFGGTRTFHRMVCAIEDAGFEIRDTIGWLYGQGFPKSLNVAKAMDKEAIVTQEEANQWDGWGTALKPSFEPICMARKPISEKTVAKNVLKWGTGAINIDACRIDYLSKKDIGNPDRGKGYPMLDPKKGFNNNKIINNVTIGEKGRFPANTIHDGSDEVLQIFPISEGMAGGGKQTKKSAIMSLIQVNKDANNEHLYKNNSGSAARFFYCAKASKSDRNTPTVSNNHPTVKPTALMQYLCKLVTPSNGIVLDPFMGSGSTGKAALLENFKFIGIELEEKYFDIACSRIKSAHLQPNLIDA
ncbi:MAG: site-specific DNA-methyltransferase, partial [Methanobacterium sp.]